MHQPVTMGRIIVVSREGGSGPAIVTRVEPDSDVVDVYSFDPRNCGFIEGIPYDPHGDGECTWAWPARTGGT